MDRDAECFLFDSFFSTDDDDDDGGDDDDVSCGYDDDGDCGDDEDEDEDDDDEDDGSQVFFFPEAHGCHASRIRALDAEKTTNVPKCCEFPPSATAERTNLHHGGPLLPLIHRLPIQDLKDERRAVSPTDTLSNLIGPLTENCRGRADKHHTAHHQSTGLQIEAHEQIRRWIHG